MYLFFIIGISSKFISLQISEHKIGERHKSEKKKDFLHDSRYQSRTPWTSRWAERASSGVGAGIVCPSARYPPIQHGGTALSAHGHPPHLLLTSLGHCHLPLHTEGTGFPTRQEINESDKEHRRVCWVFWVGFFFFFFQFRKVSVRKMRRQNVV